VRSADLSQWDAETERVMVLMNTALAHLPDFIPWTPAMIHELLSPFKQIADPELILFAEMDGKTVGFLPGIPDLNEAFIYANGLRYPWDYLRFFYHMRQPRKTMTVKSVLVLPEYWGSAAGILLMDELLQRARKKGYRRMDLSITSDDNPNTPQLAENLGARVYKRYQVYRKYGVQAGKNEGR
jgi:GNAT superfamily N-acetyltransferase